MVGRSLAETPTWSVATVITVMVAVCFIVERSIYRFGKVCLCSLLLLIFLAAQKFACNIFSSYF